MFEDRADEYRAWAAQCRAMAARAKGEKARTPWLELANKWQRLADGVASDGPAQQAQQPGREKFQAERLSTNTQISKRIGSRLRQWPHARLAEEEEPGLSSVAD
jgi:hypothetical protein